jgi:hypothetical protein
MFVIDFEGSANRLRACASGRHIRRRSNLVLQPNPRIGALRASQCAIRPTSLNCDCAMRQPNHTETVYRWTQVAARVETLVRRRLMPPDGR